MKAAHPADGAAITSAHMGLGHLRAAHALRSVMNAPIILEGAHGPGGKEDRIWRWYRRLYTIMSRLDTVPLAGAWLKGLLIKLENIAPLYPHRDLSAPGFSVRYLDYLIRRRGLCRTGLKQMERFRRLVHTFYASAVAGELYLADKSHFLVVTDSDVHRIWAPRNPDTSSITYLVPCRRTCRRLRAYGVPARNIRVTGFPLPKGLVGTEQQDALKSNLRRRLGRLAPSWWLRKHGSWLKHLLSQAPDTQQPGPMTLMCAIGGTGAQVDLLFAVLTSLRAHIQANRIRAALSLGVNQSLVRRVTRFLRCMDLTREQVEIVAHKTFAGYFDRFNRTLAHTDVLWTKPSELAFYASLGLPIVTAPAIGAHEDANRRWLSRIHAGLHHVPARCMGDWLTHAKQDGLLARAAVDGFAYGNALGAYNIRDLALSTRQRTCKPG